MRGVEGDRRSSNKQTNEQNKTKVSIAYTEALADVTSPTIL